MSALELTPGQLAANTIRGLAMDAIQAANSGHPGAPMGMADMAVVLWTRHLRYDPLDPAWADRDRVVLSNGHASTLLYSSLFLSGTAFSIEALRSFRQWGSPAAGHPELGEAPGIETTTGPLGQGIANAVGMAMAERFLRERFGEELCDHRIWCFVGDGCLMEGISYEAASVAGHLGLGRLNVLFDDNGITIDGKTELTVSEDMVGRFEAAGWHVLRVDGHDHDALDRAMAEAKAETQRPSLICCKTTIAWGSPRLAGSNKSHGSPLGAPEVAASKARLGLDPEAFFQVPAGVLDWFRSGDQQRLQMHREWRERLAASPRKGEWEALYSGNPQADVQWPEFATGGAVATRKAGQMALSAASAAWPGLVGGSADLAGSNGSTIPNSPAWSRADFSGRNIHFGIREHAMAAMSNGLALHGGVRPYCATFLVFHDYMRPAVRLSALMHLPVVYLYTHDSVHVGEDGPTHQPIEHLMAMRGIPNLHVVRPADGPETVEAWRYALARRDGPTALCLSRQDLRTFPHEGSASAEGLHRGAYVLRASQAPEALVLVATGSEVGLAVGAAEQLEADGIGARVVSMPCWEAFLALPAGQRAEVLPPGLPRVSVEAGITLGWQAIVGLDGASVGIDRFGASAPGEVVAERLGLSVARVVQVARGLLGR